MPRFTLTGNPRICPPDQACPEHVEGLSGELCIAIRLSHQKALHSHLTKLANYANISHWLTVT
jgi:hypothetical protein